MMPWFAQIENMVVGFFFWGQVGRERGPMLQIPSKFTAVFIVAYKKRIIIRRNH